MNIGAMLKLGRLHAEDITARIKTKNPRDLRNGENAISLIVNITWTPTTKGVNTVKKSMIDYGIFVLKTFPSVNSLSQSKSNTIDLTINVTESVG
jgi:hypothetical protein